MKKKIILIFLIFSITSLEVKAEGESDNWELFEEKSNEKIKSESIQINLYIPKESLNFETYIGQIEPCGTNSENIFHAILDVPIIFHYSYAIQNYYYNKVYAGGSFVYDYTINESIWWEPDSSSWSVYLSGNDTCNNGTSIPIGDDIDFKNKYKITTIANKDVYINNNFNDVKTWNTDLRNELVSKALIGKISEGMPTVLFAFPDSNDIKKENGANAIGKMVSENTKFVKWLAGENNSITRTFKYKIYDVYIDFRNNANIIYSTSNEIADETGYVKIANNNNLFFVPLNHPSGTLKIEATYEKFGLLGIDIDDVTTTASVTVTQNLYNDDGSYKINYRPIDVSKVSINNKAYIDKIARYKNWNDWLKQGGNEYFTQNVNRIKYSYDSYPDGYDYKVSFSGKSDLNSDWNYSDWTNINRNGSSNFLSNNSKIDQKINTTKNYCEIGEFSDDCNIRNN